jgi:hypothetical protein
VTVAVVESLEVVDIDHQQGDAERRPFLTLYLVVDAVAEIAVVVDLGQTVEDRRLPHLAQDSHLDDRRILEFPVDLEKIVQDRYAYVDGLADRLVDLVPCLEQPAPVGCGLARGEVEVGKDEKQIAVYLVSMVELQFIEAALPLLLLEYLAFEQLDDGVCQRGVPSTFLVHDVP